MGAIPAHTLIRITLTLTTIPIPLKGTFHQQWVCNSSNIPANPKSNLLFLIADGENTQQELLAILGALPAIRDHTADMQEDLTELLNDLDLKELLGAFVEVCAQKGFNFTINVSETNF